MSCPEYVLCNWLKRLWPAKVLSVGHHNSKDGSLSVEILCLEERIQVKAKDTKPLEKTEIEVIAEKLVHTQKDKPPDTTIADLTYRKALRSALEILNSALENSKSPATPRITRDLSRRCKRTSSCQDEVSEGTETTSGEQQETRTTDEQNGNPKRKTVCKVYTPKNHGKSPTPVTNNQKSSKSSKNKDMSLRKSTTNKPAPQKPSRKRTRDSSSNEDGGKSEKRPALCASDNLHTPGAKRKTQKTLPRRKALPTLHDKPTAKKSANEEDGTMLNTPVQETKKTNRQKEQTITPRSRKEKMHRKESCGIAETGSDVQGMSDTEKKPVNRYKPLPMPDFEEEIAGLTSPELSMVISGAENGPPTTRWSDEYTEEDEDLPSVLQSHCRGPDSIEPGMFVWCKYQKFPYWPSFVKSVKKKERKASVLFVEKDMADPNNKTQSFQVPLGKLKPYDCEEKQELLDATTGDYKKCLEWCDKVISDYRIRVGCGSFSGSFTEYCIADISYPVRRELLPNSFVELFPVSQSETTESEIEETPSKSQGSRKLLPDRDRAARDRANEKLVEFIAKTKRAESHLLDILARKKKSRWLNTFLSSKRQMNFIDPYMEDEEQVIHVVTYLQGLCEQGSDKEKKLMKNDKMGFVLDVLLPEAIIFAMSAIDQISYERAEKKYMDGPTISRRERSQFEAQILKMKKLKKSSKLHANKCSP